MTTQEFSDQFDVLYNNITSNQAPGLDEYEKSVFLTKAQNQLVTEYFNNRVDQVGGGFDGSLKRLYDFSSLIQTKALHPATPANRLDKRSRCYTFPADYFLSVNEQVSDNRYLYSVLPLSYDEYMRLMQKPYAYPVKRGVWRLITGRQNQYIGKDNKGMLLGTQLSSLEAELSFFHTTITIDSNNQLNSNKWYGQSPFSTLIGESIPTAENPRLITTSGSNGLACKLPGMAFITYIEIKHSGEHYQVRFYNIGIAATFPDALILEWTNTIVLNYVNNNPTEDTEYHRFFNTFGNIERKGGTGITRNFAVPRDDESISTYSSSYSSKYNKDTFTFEEIDLSYPLIEIIGRFSGSIDYTLRYIKRPAPIILTDLTDDGYDGVSIEGIKAISDCELPEETHQEILERAVTLAKIAWQGGTATQATANSRQNNNE